MRLDALGASAVGRLVRFIQAPWLAVDVVNVVADNHHVGVTVRKHRLLFVAN